MNVILYQKVINLNHRVEIKINQVIKYKNRLNIIQNRQFKLQQEQKTVTY